MNLYRSVFLTLSMTVAIVASSAAQQGSDAPGTAAADPCAEPYSCIDERLLSEAEARSSLGHPDRAEPSPSADQLVSLE